MTRTFEDVAAELGPLWPTPTNAANVDDGNALECWSVSAILNALNRFGLNYWKNQQVARTALRRADTTRTMSEEEAIDFLTSQKNWVGTGYEMSERDLGSEVHAALEHFVLQDAFAGSYHPEAAPMVAQFHDWCLQMTPRFIAAEMTVFDPVFLYAGTADAIVELNDGKRYLIDYKTTRNDRDKNGKVRQPYAEWALQLAAYRYAPLACPARVEVPPSDDPKSPRRYYITKEEYDRAVPMPKVDGCLIVQLSPQAWRVWPVRVEEDARDAFLYLREVSRFTEVIARRSVFGAYLEGKAAS